MISFNFHIHRHQIIYILETLSDDRDTPFP